MTAPDTPFLRDLVDDSMLPRYRRPRLLAAALQRMGFCLIPIRPGSTSPACPWSEFQERHPSPDRLASWLTWSQHIEGFWFAVVTGAISDLVVVHTHHYKGEEWADEHLPETPYMVMTRRGWHRYYLHPGGHMACRRLAPGVELKGEGAYVPAPGCPHPDGWIHLPVLWWRTDCWSTAPVLRLPDLGEPCPEPTASGATRDGGGGL